MKRQLTIISCLAALSFPVSAETVPSGYFRGVDVEPLLDSDVSLVQSDPAVVLVFSATPQSSDIAAQFDTWYQQSRPANTTAFGIITGSEAFPVEVVEEVLRQRGRKFPVFFTDAPLPGGNTDRVLILNRGQARTLPGVDSAAIAKELSGGLTVAATPAAAPATPTIAAATPAAATVTPALAQATPTPPPAVPTAPPVTGLAATPIVVPAGASASLLPANAAVTTMTAAAATRAGTYTNPRYDYVVQFPTDRTFTEAQNGDGAVTKPSDDSSLDFRVWATVNNASGDGTPGTMSMSDYLKRHLSFIAEEYSAQVNVEKRYVIQDGDLEGRDYTYSYVKPSRRTGQSYEIRGRIQVFEKDGIFKIANVEGLQDEFDKSSDAIEKFIVSFKPDSR